MVERKSLDQFRKTGLVLIVNQILHVFGWALVFKVNTRGEAVDWYPARVKFRGFDEKSTSEAYKKVTEYMDEQHKNLLEEVNE